jgi:hypothetical protein
MFIEIEDTNFDNGKIILNINFIKEINLECNECCIVTSKIHNFYDDLKDKDRVTTSEDQVYFCNIKYYDLLKKYLKVETIKITSDEKKQTNNKE